MQQKVKVLMIDDNEYIVGKVKNYFKTHEVSEVNLTASNGKDGLNLIKDHQDEYDLILMDLIMPEIDGITLLSKMRELGITKHVIILTSYKKEYTVKAVSEFDIDYYMLKPFNMESLETRILEVMDVRKSHASDKQSRLAIEVSDMLHKLGVPSHIRGYEYLRDGVLMIYNNPSMVHKITKEIYPDLAVKYDTTTPRVERAIRHAIEVSWARGDYKLMEKYFGNSIDFEKSKPTNSEFIVTLTDRLRLDNKMIVL